MTKFFLMTLIMVLTAVCQPVFAAETSSAAPMTNGQEIKTVMKRGWTNLFTFPGEVVRTAQNEKQNHPKAWPLTYAPRVFLNVIVRAVSSANDMLILPTYAWATNDTRAMTQFFDMPDYVWEKV